MMRSVYIALLLTLAAGVSNAGVTLDMVTVDNAGNESERTAISSQGGKLRMDTDVGEFGSDVSMVFLGDRFLVIDHDEKKYIIMDEAMLDEVSAKMNQVMQQMEAQLAQLPPEQRAMAEQMMKQQMGALTTTEAAPPPRVEAMGPGEWQGTPCTRYAVFDGVDKTQEVCAAPLNQIEGADEMMEAFMGMAKFVQQLAESLPGPFAADLSANPGAVMDQMDGFPIHSIEYSAGKKSGETMLENVNQTDLDDALFAAPDGYRLEDPFAGR